jgi:hypothetical protein
MTTRGGFSNKPFAMFALAAFFWAAGAPLFASDSEFPVRYEYRLIRLGSLSSLQKDDTSGARHSEVETALNKAGLEGWELVNVFAVRTTFDPNVFFAVMKRPTQNPAGEGEKQ